MSLQIQIPVSKETPILLHLFVTGERNFVHTGTYGLNNFTIVEVSIAVKFFTETRLLALCSNPQPGEYPF
jgi:hypothetical protein